MHLKNNSIKSLKRRLIFGALILFALSGCAKKDKLPKSGVITESKLLSIEDKSRLFDIPFPIEADIWQSDLIGTKKTVLQFANKPGYKSVDFYKEEMPKLGWHQVTTFEADSQSNLVYKKPSKLCTIYIAVDRVILFLGPIE